MYTYIAYQRNVFPITGNPDKTPLRINKAGYTATEVACGWAGAILRSLDYLGRSSEVKEIKS